MLYIEEISFDVSKLEYEKLVKSLNNIDYLNVYEQENEDSESNKNGTYSSFIENLNGNYETKLSGNIDKDVVTVFVPSNYIVLLKDFEPFTIIYTRGYHDFENHCTERGVFWDNTYKNRAVVKFKTELEETNFITWFFTSSFNSEKQDFTDYHLYYREYNLEMDNDEVGAFINFENK